jgi:hypothetical protein
MPESLEWFQEVPDLLSGTRIIVMSWNACGCEIERVGEFLGEIESARLGA